MSDAFFVSAAGLKIENVRTHKLAKIKLCNQAQNCKTVANAFALTLLPFNSGEKTLVCSLSNAKVRQKYCRSM